MPAIARIGDRTIGTCSAHPVPITVGGTITAGAGTADAENSPIARVGDEVTLDCGHKSAITGGSPDVIVEGSACARLGDPVAQSPYNGTIISAASTSFAN